VTSELRGRKGLPWPLSLLGGDLGRWTLLACAHGPTAVEGDCATEGGCSGAGAVLDELSIMAFESSVLLSLSDPSAEESWPSYGAVGGGDTAFLCEEPAAAMAGRFGALDCPIGGLCTAS
jgi:hypothetical protein